MALTAGVIEYLIKISSKVNISLEYLTLQLVDRIDHILYYGQVLIL